jgi:predicted PurR-regulated permease PerM
MNFPPPTQRQARLIWTSVTALALALLLALIVGLGWVVLQLVRLLSPVLWPLAVAGIVAYLLDPLVDRFERAGVPRTRAILCVFAIALMLLVALVGSVVPQLVHETGLLLQKVPSYATQLQQRIDTWASNPPDLVRRYLGEYLPWSAPTNEPAATNLDATLTATNTAVPAVASTNVLSFWDTALDRKTLQSATSWLAKVLPKLGAWLFGQVSKVASWFGVLAGLALIPIYAFYFLLEKRGIESNWINYLPVAKSEFRDEMAFVIKSINDYLIVFFRGQVLVAVCDGVLYAIGFMIIGLPYAVLLGVLATFLTMIPYLGAIVTCVAALVLAFVQYGDWKHPLLVLAVFGVVQTLEGFFISPKIMGDRVGLHPLTIIVAVMVGTTVMGGILGGILAIPLTAALRVLMFHYVWRKPKETRAGE